MSFKRKVFYLSGFDPRGARHYHALYTEQAARYAALSGEAVSVSKRRRGAGHSVDWTVANRTADVETDYSFLAWDDIIRRDHWIANPTRLLGISIRTYLHYLRRIDWPAAFTMPRWPIITLFYPPITTLLVPFLLLLILFGLGSIWLPWYAALAVGAVAAGIAAATILNKFKSLWLLRFFIFNDGISERGLPPDLADRLDEFAGQIAAALDGDHDEILLVTHSNGSILSVPLMECVLRRTGPALPDRFALVTLGHCVPLISLRSDATAFRDSLRAVNLGAFRWIDIGSPPDGAAYTLTDPFGQVGGVVVPRLELISARIFKFHARADYERKRRNKYEFHFEYLRCGERLSPIDHPSMTAGPRDLAGAVAAFKAIK